MFLYRCKTKQKLAAESSATLGNVAWVGIAIGSLLLGMGIMAVIMLGIQRWVVVKYCNETIQIQPNICYKLHYEITKDKIIIIHS